MKPLSKARPRILILGQTPPPYHGQGLMIQALLQNAPPDIDFFHVRMNFSRDIQEVGKAGVGKLIHLVSIIMKSIAMRFKHSIDTLYYPPASPAMVPLLRDIVVLSAIRPFFRKRIYHFHASGLGVYLSQSSAPIRFLARIAYGRPDLSITLSPLAPRDGEWMHTKAEAFVPIGVADSFVDEPAIRSHTGPVKRLLFIGMLSEEKGLRIAVESTIRLLLAGNNVELLCLGSWKSDEFRTMIYATIAASGFERHFNFPGVVVGEQKAQVLRDADIFVFPTFYSAETFPLVVLEAMSASLPCVTTRWRAIPDMIDDGVHGILVPTEDVTATVNALSKLLQDRESCFSMGRAARVRYEENFTLPQHISRMNNAFRQVVCDGQV